MFLERPAQFVVVCSRLSITHVADLGIAERAMSDAIPDLEFQVSLGDFFFSRDIEWIYSLYNESLFE
jgi:hypothetical protein